MVRKVMDEWGSNNRKTHHYPFFIFGFAVWGRCQWPFASQCVCGLEARLSSGEWGHQSTEN
jgi:hypothetical protein